MPLDQSFNEHNAELIGAGEFAALQRHDVQRRDGSDHVLLSDAVDG